MIKPKCSKCDKELKEPGGIAFSPPLEFRQGLHDKVHLCGECWSLFREWLRGYIKI